MSMFNSNNPPFHIKTLSEGITGHYDGLKPRMHEVSSFFAGTPTHNEKYDWIKKAFVGFDKASGLDRTAVTDFKSPSLREIETGIDELYQATINLSQERQRWLSRFIPCWVHNAVTQFGFTSHLDAHCHGFRALHTSTLFNSLKHTESYLHITDQDGDVMASLPISREDWALFLKGWRSFNYSDND